MNKSLEVLIKECVKQVLSEQDFGEYLFGQELGLPNKENPERNSPEENKLKNDLVAHYGGGMSSLNKWIPKLTALNRKGMYKHILQVPKKYKYAYRQLSNVSTEQLTKILGYEPTDVEPNQVYYEDGVFLNPNRSPHQSWTVDFDIFKEMVFSDHNVGGKHKKDHYFVIVGAKVADNEFLLNPDATELFSGQYSYQKEIISVGPVTCDKIWFIRHKTIKDPHLDYNSDLEFIDSVSNVK